MFAAVVRLIGSTPSYSVTRLNHFKNVKSWEGGINYPGFTYFPRPGEKDPPYEPSKLLMVRRIKPVKYTPYYFRVILEDLKLDDKMEDVAIVKNIPEMVAKLWKIKHLVQILPITFPHGYPEDGDFSSGYLDKHTGEFFVHKNLADERTIKATEEFISDPLRVDADTLIKKLRDRWLNSRL